MAFDIAETISCRSVVPATPTAQDEHTGLIDLVEQLTLLTNGAASGVDVSSTLRSVPWADQHPYVLQVLVDAARAHLHLVEEHRHSEELRRGLEHLATHDPLTALPNRTLVLDRIEHALLAASRSGGVVAVLFLDVDGFKQINDTLGHACGDIVLAEVAARLRRSARESDTVGRMYGDEFVIVCEALTGTPDAVTTDVRRLAKRLAEALNQPSPDGLREVVVSASIGAAITAPSTCTNAAQLLAAADAAMYEAKCAGGGRLSISAAHDGCRPLAPAPSPGGGDQ